MVDLLKELKLNDPHKFILYVSGIIFILSFFTNPINIDILKLRYGSLTFMIASIILWGIQQYMDWDIESRIQEMSEDHYFSSEIKREIKPKVIKWYITLGIVYFIAIVIFLLLII